MPGQVRVCGFVRNAMSPCSREWRSANRPDSYTERCLTESDRSMAFEDHGDWLTDIHDQDARNSLT